MFPSQSCNKCISYEGKTLASVNIYIGKYSKFKSLNIRQLSLLNNNKVDRKTNMLTTQASKNRTWIIYENEKRSTS